MTKEERTAAIEEFMAHREKGMDDEIAALLEKYLKKNEERGASVFWSARQQRPHGDDDFTDFIASVARHAPASSYVLWKRVDNDRFIAVPSNLTDDPAWVKVTINLDDPKNVAKLCRAG